MEKNLSLEHFVKLLNQLNNSESSFGKNNTFRLQVLLLHLYSDYLMINILKKDLPLHKDMIKRSEGFSTRLHVIHARGILSDEGFRVLKELNAIRNKLQHDYEISLESLASKISRLEAFPGIDNKKFANFDIISRLELACVRHINALRVRLDENKENFHSIAYLLNPKTGKIEFKAVWGNLKNKD